MSSRTARRRISLAAALLVPLVLVGAAGCEASGELPLPCGALGADACGGPDTTVDPDGPQPSIVLGPATSLVREPGE